MSAKAKVNKSELIRELLLVNPDINAREAAKVLWKQNRVKVGPGLFSFTKHQMKPANGKPGRIVTMTPEAVAAFNAYIRKVKTVAAEVGGMSTLKAVLDAICE